MIDLYREMTASELADEAGLATNTILNWTKTVKPLVFTGEPGRRMFTWTDLIAFCERHPELRGTAKALRAAKRSKAGSPADTDERELDDESMRALVRNARAAAQSNMNAVVQAARSAEKAARSHRKQMEQLAASMNALDDMLTIVTASMILND